MTYVTIFRKSSIGIQNYSQVGKPKISEATAVNNTLYNFMQPKQGNITFCLELVKKAITFVWRISGLV